MSCRKLPADPDAAVLEAQRVALQQLVERQRRGRLVGRDAVEDVALPGAPLHLPDAERQREQEDRQHMIVGQSSGRSFSIAVLFLERRSSRWVYCCAINKALRRRSSQTAPPKVSGSQISTCSHHGGSKRNSTQNTSPITIAPSPRMTNTAGPSPASLPRRSRPQAVQRSTTVSRPRNSRPWPQRGQTPRRATSRAIGAARSTTTALPKDEPPGIAPAVPMMNASAAQWTAIGALPAPHQ